MINDQRNTDKDVSLNRSIKMWKNIPLDSRQITPSLNEMDEYINYPYVGMIFYSEFEDDYYKVLSLEDGYRVGRTGEITRASQVDNPSSAFIIKGYFIGSYEQYVLKGNTATMIKKAYIDDAGYLHIVFADGQDTNVGYVIGDPGYCPQISENSDNDMETLSDLIYKLDIKYCDEVTHLQKVLVTPNLMGPYIVNIEDQIDEKGNKTGYINFILNTGKSYTVGPYGIKNVKLTPNSDGSKKYLIITFNDGTELNLGNVRGDDGASVNIIGTLKNKDELPTNAQKGDAYIIGKDLWYFYTYWKNVGQIVGDDGKTPNINITSRIIKANPSDEDQRNIMHIEFFDGEMLIADPIEFRIPYSPEINIISNSESTFKVQFVTYTNHGQRIEINSPNLKGEDGKSINIKGSITSYTDLLSYSVTAEEGDGYIVDNVDDPNDGHLWIYTGDTSIEDSKHYKGFLDCGKIKGPQGTTGPQGDHGSDGYQIKFRTTVKEDKTKWIQYCYIDKEGNEVSQYTDLIDIVEITGSDGISPMVEVIENENSTTLKITDINGVKYTANLRGSSGDNGLNGRSIEVRYNNQEIQYRYYIEESDGNKTYPDGSDWITLCTIPQITQQEVENGIKLTIGEDTYYITNGKTVTLRYNSSTNYIEWQYVGDTIWNQLIAIDAISGTNGKNVEIGNCTTSTLPAGSEAIVNIVKNTTSSDDTKNVYDFSFQIPKGDKGEQGYKGVGINKIEGVYDTDNILTDIKITTIDPSDNSTKQTVISVGDLKGNDGNNGNDGNDGNGISSITVKNYNPNSDTLTLTINYTDIPSQDISITGLKGKQGEKGEDGVSISSISQTTSSTESSGKNVITITLTDGTTKTFNVYNGEKGADGQQGEDGVAGEDGFSPTITSKEVTNGIELTITNKTGSNKVTILNGTDGQNGEKGADGQSPTVTITPTENGNTVIITDVNGEKSFDILNGEKGADGQQGEDGFSPTITINPTTNGTTVIITDVNGEKSFDILNGEKGADGQQGEDGFSPIVSITPTESGNTVIITDVNGEKSFDILNGTDGQDGVDGFSPTIVENPDNTTTIYKLDITYKNETGETQTITTPNLKGDNGEAANFIFCEALPNIDVAELNTIYCLLTPVYQRGLNIGLTDDTNANKNFYEEWIVVEKEDGSRSWEILAPQVYRISEKMIDYVWKVRNDYTVYDDWFDTTDISEYQKEYGDITPLSNFVYRIEGSELILVKYIGSGDVYLNIAPRYKIGDKVYTVTELDGTYYPEKTYYQIDDKGKVTNYNFDTESFQYDDNGIEITQTLLTGPQVYSLYIADTVTKLTRVLINTSNIPKYHIPSGIETIGDYAFYSSANQTMVFEKLSADGKTAVQVGFESSNVKYIGEYGCACTTNMRMINDEGIDTNYLTTPAGLKKISNHAFYRAGQIAHVDTRKSSNLYVGKEAFARANLSAVQYLSPTTYYTDNSFLGYTELYHNSRVVNGGGLYFYNNDTIGYNYNDVEHTEASETAKLNVTLNTVDPVFE